jgi:predicted transcriptional regulator
MDIPAEIRSEIERRVASKQYKSPTEVFRRMLEGLRSIESEEEEIRREVALGFEEIERGEVVGLEEAFAELRRRHEEEEIRREVALGLAEIERGEVVDGETAMAELRRRHEEEHGKKIFD